MRIFRCRYKYLLLSGLAVIPLAACSTTIERTQLQEKLLKSPASLTIDVRSAEEYNAGHIPGALHIPFYSVVSGLESRAIPKDEPIVIYCEHGPRAGLAGIILYFHGYGKVSSLEGHMRGWREGGLPVETLNRVNP